MIRYNVSRQTIEAAVDALSPTWRKRAKTRSQKIIANGGFSESTSIWSEVKPVFIQLQKRKCAFCERQFESEEIGTIEYDLEHFRPKSSVKSWPPPGWARKYDFTLGDASDAGYFWLAYDLGNYAASCKVCNTVFKSNYFPIAGKRVVNPDEDIEDEAALLCYPIGDADEDPSKLITFRGTTAVPVRKTGKKRRRAEVIIDFFGLNTNDQLHKERARMITLVGQALDLASKGVETAENREFAKKWLQPHLPHTNCTQAFHALWDEDEAVAREHYRAARKLATSAP